MYRKIVRLLDDAGVSYETFEHEHVHSSADAAKVRGTKIEEAAKALVLAKGDGTLFQCIVSGGRRLDLKKIKTLLDEKNVSLAHPDKVFDATGCKVGSVPPFGNLFDSLLPMYADQELFTREHIVFCAGSHHHSVRMLANDWLTLTGAEMVDIGKASQT